MDITAKEVLEEALQHYAGAVLLISHDRYFLSQVANTIFSFQDRRVERHDCDYHDFLQKQAEALLQQQQQELEQDDSLQDPAQSNHHDVAPITTLKDKVTSSSCSYFPPASDYVCSDNMCSDFIVLLNKSIK